MLKFIQFFCLTEVLIFCVITVSAQDPYGLETQPVQFKARDGVTISGDVHHSDSGRVMILLCHQGGSNARGEYGSTFPRLAAEGYSVMAIDLRSGGDLYGFENRTASQLKQSYGFCDASADIQAALDFISRRYSLQVIIIGSSYSASLAISTALERPIEVLGVAAFSPSSGGPMAQCLPDEGLKNCEQKLLLIRPGKELQLPSVQKQFDLAQQHGHQTFNMKFGIHGSSMLVADRVSQANEEVWQVLLNYLSQVSPKI